MKISGINKTVVKFFSFLGLVVYFLIIVSVFNQGLKFNYVLFFVGLIALLFLLYKNNKRIISFYKRHIYIMRFLVVMVFVFGFVVRFLFIIIPTNFAIDATLSDTGVHWYGAQQIIENGKVDQEVGDYENLFPYLSTYTGTLSVSMSIFGKNYNAVLFSNVIFDLISCLCLYVLFYLWKKDKDIGLLAATVWAINPLQIIFCGMPLAIVVVNMFIIGSILCIFLTILNKDSWGKLCFLSGFSGLLLAMGNMYRPIFIIILLSFLVYWLIAIFKDKKEIKIAITSCVIIVIGYLLVGLLSNVINTQINPYYNGGKSQAGWSFYVGSNYDTGGKWSSDDRDIFFGPVLIDEAKGDVEVANSIIFRKGIKRYLNILTGGHIVSHFLNKIAVVFGDTQNSIYDLPYIFNFSKDSEKYRIIKDCIMVFYSAILIILGCFITKKIRKKEWLKENTFMLFLVILFSALFFASLLVEVMNRYSLPFITILIIIVFALMPERGSKKVKI